jgi:hypothetical protein
LPVAFGRKVVQGDQDILGVTIPRDQVSRGSGFSEVLPLQNFKEPVGIRVMIFRGQDTVRVRIPGNQDSQSSGLQGLDFQGRRIPSSRVSTGENFLGSVFPEVMILGVMIPGGSQFPDVKVPRGHYLQGSGFLGGQDFPGVRIFRVRVSRGQYSQGPGFPDVRNLRG